MTTSTSPQPPGQFPDDPPPSQTPPPLYAPGGRPSGGVQPPGHAAPHAHERDATGLRIGIGLAFLSLLLLALGALFLLPDAVHEAPPESTAAPVTPPQIPTTPAAAEDQGLAAQANVLLEKTLELRARLELASAPVWAEQDWRTLEEAKHKADRALDQKRLEDAIEGYEQLGNDYQALGERRQDYGQDLMNQGKAAYASGDAATAVAALEKARAAIPDDPDIEKALTRARLLDRVLTQMRLADATAQAGDKAGERQALKMALDIDPDYAPAAERLQGLQAELDAAAFRKAMGQALTALDQGRWNDARKALEQAARLRPDDPAVTSTRIRLNGARRADRLDHARRRAQAAETREDWSTAKTEYRKALGIDAQSAFAQDGLTRADRRLRLHERLDHYLQQPDRLYRATPLAAAEHLSAAAGREHPNEPKLKRKINRLREQIRLAKTPISIRLRSDGKTDVTLRPVAHLGRFETRDLELRPGDYILTGIRIGYRDVRRVFQLRPGRRLPPIGIRCEERID